MASHDIPPLPDRPSIVAIDLDGTALDSTGRLRTRTREAIEAVLAHDVRLAVVTARPMRGVLKLLGAELLERVELVHVDGAVVDRTGHPRHTHPLPDGAAEVIVKAARRVLPGKPVVVELEGWEFGADHALTTEELWEYNSATPEMVIPTAEAIARGGVKIAINGLDRSTDRLAEMIEQELGDSVRLLRERIGTSLSVVSPGVGKRSGVARLLDGGNPEWQTAIAFGDDYSDIELLEVCGVSFAMANAAPEVLDAARYRTATNDDDGVAQVLEALIASLG